MKQRYLTMHSATRSTKMAKGSLPERREPKQEPNTDASPDLARPHGEREFLLPITSSDQAISHGT